MRNRTGCFASALVLVALVCGCANDRFTRANYEQVTLGRDTRKDVRGLLGRPNKEFGDKRDEWFYDSAKSNVSARVFFGANGTVAGKQWIDANNNEWSGADFGSDDAAGDQPKP